MSGGRRVPRGTRRVRHLRGAELTAEGLNLAGVRRVLDLEDRNRALLRQLAGREAALR